MDKLIEACLSFVLESNGLNVKRECVRLTLCFSHHRSIIVLIMRKTLDKTVHIKGIQLAIGLLLL